MTRTQTVDCCVVGGGPAGMMAGLLFARAGCRTIVLEKHGDFLRDFRGDTVHPSTLEVMRELGLLEAFLRLPHEKMTSISGAFYNEEIEIADFASIDASAQYIAMMPQWELLNFISRAATSLPTCSIEMNASATDLIEESGQIVGVRAETVAGPLDVRARLTIGADGRGSTIRERSGLKLRSIGAPIDVLWFRMSRVDKTGREQLFNAGPGCIIIAINRGDYYQCAYVIPKGGADAVRAKGIEAFRSSVAETVPRLAEVVGELTSFDDVKLLTVAIDRLEQWCRPGLLMIGDSAHAMSPVGGVGINLAVQDAVAAANLFAGPLADGKLSNDDLPRLQKRRAWPVRATQFAQVQAQNRVLTPFLSKNQGSRRAPLPLRLISRSAWLKRRFAALVGLGVRPEHVHSPEKHKVKAPEVQ